MNTSRIVGPTAVATATAPTRLRKPRRLISEMVIRAWLLASTHEVLGRHQRDGQRPGGSIDVPGRAADIRTERLLGTRRDLGEAGEPHRLGRRRRRAGGQ